MESENNRARADMPDLGFTVEVGPMVLIRLWTSPDKKHYLNFESPFRYVMELDLPLPKGVGLFTIPYLNLVNLPRKETGGWGSEVSFAVMFADRHYHDHYYSVDSPFVTPSRPFYKARGGMNGYSMVLIFNKRFKNLYAVPFIRYDSVSGTVFEDSPLVRKKNYIAAGTGLFWLF